MARTVGVPGSFTIERRYPATPARVFAAFADPSLKKSWFAASDTHEVEAFTSDFRVGGAERLTYRFGATTPFPRALLTSEGVFHDIVDQERIVTSSRMSIEGTAISVALEMIEIVDDGAGTCVTCTFQGIFFEGSDGATMREQGWHVLLDRLGASLAR
ncbi:SRPBCC domain-containing protein [Sphingomonas sp. BK580]|uniref:SRPBCC domain-containing protein n=1 Tax=Sphingomonas sp. BK580 TaxID=2586972 RepID=UPI00161BEEDF|nr:SRPBCC domain-containing protein [Sphingomonas sp. BK580]MBB3691842.1 uncharacterized protein YndB with AHSA1/START domain [Sphingomonas sp. BK580]